MVGLGRRSSIVPFVLGGTSMKRNMIRLTLGLAAMCVVVMGLESQADARLFGGRGRCGGGLFGGHRHHCHQQASCCETACEAPVCETECAAPVEECCPSDCGCDSGCGHRHRHRLFGRNRGCGGGCGCDSGGCGCGGGCGGEVVVPANGAAPAPAAPEAPAEPAAPAAPSA